MLKPEIEAYDNALAEVELKEKEAAVAAKEAAAAALSDADKLVELKAIVLGIQRVFWRLKTHKVRVNV